MYPDLTRLLCPRIPALAPDGYGVCGAGTVPPVLTLPSYVRV